MRSLAPVGLSLSVLVALVATGCSGGGGSSDSIAEAFTHSVVTDAQSASEIIWQPCLEDEPELAREAQRVGRDVDDFVCAVTEVPLDWEHPDNGQTIEVALAKAPATGAAVEGALFVNPGGPGESAIELALDLALDESFSKVGAAFDIIGLDPRGTGESSAIDCDEAKDDEIDALATCLERHPEAAFIGTKAVAWDMDYLRRSLGYEEMNYLGFSYGTVLGATYAHMFPEAVGKMVLDSATPVSWASPAGAFDQEAAIVAALDQVGKNCTGGAEKCPFTSADDLGKLVEELDQHPRQVTTDKAAGDEELTGQDVYGYLTAALYTDEAGVSAALTTVAEALGGSTAAAQQILDDSGEAYVNAAGTIISCLSAPPGGGDKELRQRIDQAGIPGLMGGTGAKDEVLERFSEDYCQLVPRASKDYLDSFSAPVEVPILVVGITGDHATPYEGAEALTSDLGNARLLTLEGSGHAAAYSHKSSCIDNYVTNYLVNGVLPPTDAVCQPGETIK